MRILLNQDEKLVHEIKSKIIENNGYCPCSIIQNDDTKCMCKEFREQVEEGYCHCELYRKVAV